MDTTQLARDASSRRALQRNEGSNSTLLGEYPVNPAQMEPRSPASAHSDSLADDMGSGGANRDAEIVVGRIPLYSD